MRTSRLLSILVPMFALAAAIPAQACQCDPTSAMSAEQGARRFVERTYGDGIFEREEITVKMLHYYPGLVERLMLLGQSDPTSCTWKTESGEPYLGCMLTRSARMRVNFVDRGCTLDLTVDTASKSYSVRNLREKCID